MSTNLQDTADIGAMCGPTVTVTNSSDGMSVEISTAIPLGTVHGGVWCCDFNAEDCPCWGATCPACDWSVGGYDSPQTAYGFLRNHQRQDCLIRKDGGEQW